jgi:hypothetical protein
VGSGDEGEEFAVNTDFLGDERSENPPALFSCCNIFGLYRRISSDLNRPLIEYV